MLTVRLQQQFGNFRLDIDFQAPPGLIVLFGFSGAGKSLTLRSLAGLLQPGRGYVAIDNHILFDSEARLNVPPQERRVGYVPQHYALFPHLTVADNIRFALPKPALAQSWRKKQASQSARVAELLAALELKGLEQRFPSTLSGGQQQRVALARALAAEPRILLLDEPFNALDIAVRQRLRDSLKQFQRRFAVPIVLVTHDHEEVQQLADTVIVLQQGRVQQVGSVQDVFFAPKTPDVAQLVGQQNIFSGTLAAPHSDQQPCPSLALRLQWLQSPAIQSQTTAPTDHQPDRCWLPLPTFLPFPTHILSNPSSLSSPSTPSARTSIAGCIRNDEVLVHSCSDPANPPIWTPRGAVQWTATLIEAQIHGPSMRLLVQPHWTKPSSGEPSAASGALEIYLSRTRWRDIAIPPGQPLLLEIGPQAIHLFETPT